MKRAAGFGIALIGLWVVSAPRAGAKAGNAAQHVSTCASIRIGEPRRGVSYSGRVRNGDYRFSVVIPKGLQGWGGVAPSAPFHGFVIYLDDSRAPSSCIDFDIGDATPVAEVESKGDEAVDTSAAEAASKSTTIHGRPAVESEARGIRDGVSMDNVNVTLMLPRHFRGYKGKEVHYTVGVSITLIAPTKDRTRTEPVFRAFLSQLRFQ